MGDHVTPRSVGVCVVGVAEGVVVGAGVGGTVGAAVGGKLGATEGEAEGDKLGATEGEAVGVVVEEMGTELLLTVRVEMVP